MKATDRAQCVAVGLAVCALLLQPVAASNSRILATGGATQLEGSAGGGIVPWAVLAGYGSNDELGGSMVFSHVAVDDYQLDVVGAAVSYDNRVEFSIARQVFHLGTLGKALGLDNKELRQDIVGVKVRIFGDLIFGALPQLSAGAQYKRHLDFAIPQAVGARRDDDIDFYVSATKLWLAALADRNVFANLTVRLSRANQTGILGFGGDRHDRRRIMLEGSAGIFVNRRVAIGFEVRQQPDNLRFSRQSDWFDVFIGYFPSKRVSIVAAYANLGTIATLPRQDGWYLSAQIAH